MSKRMEALAEFRVEAGREKRREELWIEMQAFAERIDVCKQDDVWEHFAWDYPEHMTGALEYYRDYYPQWSFRARKNATSTASFRMEFF